MRTASLGLLLYLKILVLLVFPAVVQAQPRQLPAPVAHGAYGGFLGMTPRTGRFGVHMRGTLLANSPVQAPDVLSVGGYAGLSLTLWDHLEVGTALAGATTLRDGKSPLRTWGPLTLWARASFRPRGGITLLGAQLEQAAAPAPFDAAGALYRTTTTGALLLGWQASRIDAHLAAGYQHGEFEETRYHGAQISAGLWVHVGGGFLIGAEGVLRSGCREVPDCPVSGGGTVGVRVLDKHGIGAGIAGGLGAGEGVAPASAALRFAWSVGPEFFVPPREHPPLLSEIQDALTKWWESRRSSPAPAPPTSFGQPLPLESCGLPSCQARARPWFVGPTRPQQRLGPPACDASVAARSCLDEPLGFEPNTLERGGLHGPLLTPYRAELPTPDPRPILRRPSLLDPETGALAQALPRRPLGQQGGTVFEEISQVEEVPPTGSARRPSALPQLPPSTQLVSRPPPGGTAWRVELDVRGQPNLVPTRAPSGPQCAEHVEPGTALRPGPGEVYVEPTTGQLMRTVPSGASASLQTAEHAPPPARQPPNPYGSNGKPDHQVTVMRLRRLAESEFPGQNYRIVENQSISGREPGNVNRRPDVTVLDTRTGRVVKVYEAVRTNQAGTPVSREQKKVQEYNAAGIPVHQEPVK